MPLTEAGYYILFHAFGVISLLPWIWGKPEYLEKLRNFGVGPTWWYVPVYSLLGLMMLTRFQGHLFCPNIFQ